MSEHWIPGEPEPDIEDLPGHVFDAEAVLDRYNAGMEPICNWTTEDLVILCSALETEIRSRNANEE